MTNSSKQKGDAAERECAQLMAAPVRILSFGAGVQSSYVARASLLGEIEPFDHVVFADTGDEPADVM